MDDRFSEHHRREAEKQIAELERKVAELKREIDGKEAESQLGGA
jgi:hypothetical protein